MSTRFFFGMAENRDGDLLNWIPPTQRDKNLLAISISVGDGPAWWIGRAGFGEGGGTFLVLLGRRIKKLYLSFADDGAPFGHERQAGSFSLS